MREGVLLYDGGTSQSCDLDNRPIREEEREPAHLGVPDHVEEGNDIRPPGQILQNLDLTLYLLLLNRFEDLDDAFLVVDDIDALEDLGVLSAAWTGQKRSAS
jgi:hypothetical protein